MHNIELMKHIKDLTSDSMIVFISEPVHLEKKVQYTSYIAHSSNSFISIRSKKKGELPLSTIGVIYAEWALGNLKMLAQFYMANKERIVPFLKEYREEYERMTQAFELVRERRHQAKGWHDHAVLIIQEFVIDDQRKGLFKTMFRERFGDDAPRMDWNFFEQLNLLEQLNSLEQNGSTDNNETE